MNDGKGAPLSPLEREEYIEQHHFFTTLGQGLLENVPAQEVLATVREEILVTTKLPLAIDFLLSELKHQGAFATGMKQLGHYFTPFQCYVIHEAESDRSRFDLRVGLEILAREANYRTESISRQGLFLYQFEALCRNRLGYDSGLEAMAQDPSYNQPWRDWILTVRRQIGLIELADMVYVRSEHYHQQQAKLEGTTPSPDKLQGDQGTAASDSPTSGVLFGVGEGRIAWANRRKDPLVLFAALHRQLGYPQVPRTKRADPEQRLLPVLSRRIEQLEGRLKLLEEEQRGGIELERFYVAEQNDERRTESE